MSFKIPLYKPYLSGQEKEFVCEAIDSTWISSKGKFVNEFESSFANYINRKYALSVCNGTVALHLALESLEFPKNSIILCPTLTYVSSANAIRYAGLIPLFVDCDKYGLSDLEQFEYGIRYAKKNNLGNVVALMIVHLYGSMCDVNNIKNNINLPIIEDCAESFGSEYNNVVCGKSNSELACFSFFGNKVITTGEGGIVACNDIDLYNLCKMLRGVGQNPNLPQRYHHSIVGYNYRMTNITAAIGVAQINNKDFVLDRKRKVAEKYFDNFKQLGILDKIELPIPENCKSNYWMITIGMENNLMREGLMLYLDSCGVENRPAFLPMHCMVNLQPYYRIDKMENAESISGRYINLPSYPELKDEEIDYICNCVYKFIKSY